MKANNRNRILSLILILTVAVSTLFIGSSVAFGEETGNNVEIPINEGNFPDEKFRGYVSEHFDKDSSGGLSESECNPQLEIVAINKLNGEVKSLKGIEYITGLTTLDCSNTQISSLDVSENTNLEYLTCSNTQISSLDVSKNTALEFLHCSNTQISSLDVSKNTALETLYCRDTQISTIDVSNNTNLITLDCGFSPIEYLNVDNNAELEYLWCGYTPLKNLDISNNKELQYLNFMFSQIGEVDLTKNVNLKYLFCDGAPLSKIDTSKNINLVNFGCGDTLLKKLNLSANQNLEGLYCSNTELNELSVDENEKLVCLSCENTNLSELDLSKNTALEYLACEKTLLSGLDLSKNTKLKYLSCNEEILSQDGQPIDFKPNESLAWLNLGDNGELQIIENSKIDIEETGNGNDFPKGMLTLQEGENLQSEITIKTNNKLIDLSKEFPGIDASKITSITGATLDNGVIKDFSYNTPVVYTYNCGTAKIGNVQLEVTLNIKKNSSGGSHIPSTPPVSKPEISSGDGYTSKLSNDGKTVLITVKDDYELVEVFLNGNSQGKVYELSGLKAKDKVEVIVITKAEKIEQIKKELETVSKVNFKSRSSQVKTKSGKKAIKIKFVLPSDVEFDGIEVFRSTKKDGNYGRNPIFVTKSGTYYNTAIKKGTRYYYRARGYVEYDGMKYYSDWSAKAWRTVK